MRSVSIISKGKNTCSALVRQLREILKDRVEVRGFYLDGGIDGFVSDDLIVISSSAVKKHASNFLSPGSKVIVARRCLDYNKLGPLFDIPQNTGAILVNDMRTTAIETMGLLRESGIDHLELTPYYPAAPGPVTERLAITPGEPDLVPPCVDEVVDIGIRLIDLTSIVEILAALGRLDSEANVVSARQMKDIIGLLKETRVLKNHLEAILNSVEEGILATDAGGRVTSCNRGVSAILGLESGTVLGKRPEEFLPRTMLQDHRLLSEERRTLTDLATLNNKTIAVTRAPILKGKQSLGAVITLRDITLIKQLEARLHKRFVNEGHVAKYSLSDIIGVSPAIRQTTELARRIARSDAAVLIRGESGTGKELFAHAIHGLSERHKGPFVAVNFVALPETLLESEMFGYDEGAFTGARKGGKPGLFEEAHGGTIFLDEIGDAPLSLQAKILRVLEEKRIRRIGGTKNITVDVRIMAATNKDLGTLMRSGGFREDLFYRLNVLPLQIPPLRERKEDIPLLVHRFLLKRSRGDGLRVSREAMGLLVAYGWPGNVRDLQNVIEYLGSVCEPDGLIRPEDIVTVLGRNRWNKPAWRDGLDACDGISRWILEQIRRASGGSRATGRRSLVAESRAQGLSIGESALRRRIGELRGMGLVEVSRGRIGLRLTDGGLRVLEADEDLDDRT